MLSTVIHHRTHTFEMNAIGGLSKKAPVLCGFFLAAILANIGLPGFANFWGEIGIFISLWDFQPWMVFIAVFGVVISAIYGLRAVANVFLGEPKEAFAKTMEENEIKDISWKERFVALILFAALLLVGFWPKTITSTLNESLQNNVTQSRNVASLNLK